MDILATLQKLALESGFAGFFMAEGWKNLVMIIIAFVLLYLGIVKEFEPLLLVGIAFGCLLSNLSYFIAQGGENALYHAELWAEFINPASQYYHSYGHIMATLTQTMKASMLKKCVTAMVKSWLNMIGNQV